MRRPPDLSVYRASGYTELPASSFVEVSADLQQEAQALLAEQTFAVLTEEQGKRFAQGRLTASRADARFVLLRGLKHQSAGAGLEGKVRWSKLTVRQGESVIVSCEGSCTQHVPRVRTAVVALLSDAPKEVYTEVMTAIVGGVR